MSDYWRRRAIEDEKRAHRNAQETNAELKKLYQRQYQRIYAQMERLYGQIDWGDGEMITRTQLWEYSRWKDLEKELRQFATETPRIGIDKITSCLDKVFRETIGVDIGQFGADKQSMFRVGTDPMTIINTAWSGESFSARLWKNTNAIAARIRSDMEDMLVSGRSMSDVKKRLMEDFSVSYNDAARIVDTETSYVLNGAAVQRYRNAGLGKVRWCIAPEDGRECEICKARADKVWHIDTAPPMPAHPRCRCVWQGVVELPGEVVPCDGEGETAEEAAKAAQIRQIEAQQPKTVVNAPRQQSERVANAAQQREAPEHTGKNDIGVRLIGKINRSIYSCVTKDITTDEVVLTDERIQHIRERHPNDYEKYMGYIRQIVEEPDYILEDQPNTALILKEIQENGERFRLALRLKTSEDTPEFKNSVLTFMTTSEKKWAQNLRNKKVLYKRKKS